MNLPEFGKQPISLLSSGADDPYLDPGYQRDLLLQQAAERKKNALRSVQGLAGGVQGEYQGTPRYQHYVPDYGAPLRALADYMLSKQAIKGGQGEESQVFEDWKKQRSVYGKGARKRIYGDEGE